MTPVPVGVGRNISTVVAEVSDISNNLLLGKYL